MTRNQMILNSRFYTEFRGAPEALSLILDKLAGPKEIIDFTSVFTDKKRWGTQTNAESIISTDTRIGFITVGMPKKTFFNKVAKMIPAKFTVVSVCESEMEPTQILEYENGALIDEQQH